MLLIAFALVAAIFNVPLRILCIIEIPIGLVIAGLLLLPRFHLIDKIYAAVGDKMAQVASVGLGGVILTLLAVGLKISSRVARRAGRNDNLDFSGFTDPEKIGALIGSLITLAVFAAIALFLWKWLGIVRVFAATYIAQFAFVIFLLIVGGSLKQSQDETIEARHRAAVERMQRQSERMRSGYRPQMGPSSRFPGRPPSHPSMRQNQRGAQPGQQATPFSTR